MQHTTNHLEEYTIFPWNENLETGNKTIDEQHKVLVDLINKLARHLIIEDETEIEQAFNKLANYANTHFEDEEKIFEEYLSGAPCFESHKDTHASFFSSISNLKVEVENEPYVKGVEKIIFFLLQWLIRHIIHSDKRLISAINIIKTGKTMEEALYIANNEIDNLEKIIMHTLMMMYSEVSSNTMTLMREVEARKKTEILLNEANKELEQLLIVDPLTGLYNRRYFNTVIPRMIKKSIRDNSRISFFLIDIDYFKSINDTYGHIEGDNALKLLAEDMLNICHRPDDLVFRLGGEEFCIIASGQTEKDAIQFAEKIRKSVKELKIENINSKIDNYMTVSIGAINKIPDMNDNQDEYIKIADKRLYIAKEQGRNRVVFSG